MTTDPFDMNDPIDEPDRDRVDDDPADRHRARVEDADATERKRALRYLKALDAEELARREQIDYADHYPAGVDRKDPGALRECPVCENDSLVGSYHQGEQDDDAVVGHCIICSYERTEQIANQAFGDIEFQRALDRD